MSDVRMLLHSTLGTNQEKIFTFVTIVKLDLETVSQDAKNPFPGWARFFQMAKAHAGKFGNHATRKVAHLQLLTI